MAETFMGGMLLIALTSTVVLYWLRVGEQARQRRIEERLAEIRHVAAVMRATFAEQRPA